MTDTRGRILLEFMRENGFTILNGRTVSDSKGTFTYVNTQGVNVIDYVWVNLSHATLITDFLIDSSYKCSGHFSIIIYLQPDFFVPETDNFEQLAQQRSMTELTCKAETRKEYTTYTRHLLQIKIDFSNSTVDEQIENLKFPILESTKQVN